jgi:2'-5' RNA ligase
MQLVVVVLPPPAVVQEALDLTRGLLDVDVPEVEQPRGLGRLLRRSPSPPPPSPVLDPLPIGSVFVRVARLGNVMDADAAMLARVVREAAGQWPAPVLHVAGIRVTGDPRPELVADLGGQTDGLASIFRSLESTVRRHGFFLDRRAFRAEIALGTLDVPEGAELPVSVVEGAAPATGSGWQATDLTFVRRAHRAGRAAFEPVESFPLGG